MQVQKRTGELVPIKFDEIKERLTSLCEGLDKSVDPATVTVKTVMSLYDGIATSKIDIISAGIAEDLKTIHPDYAILAGRILVSNLHKTTPATFSECMAILRENLKYYNNRYLDFIGENAAKLDAMIRHETDYRFDYFGFKTLSKSYLQSIGAVIVDRPQYVFMRVAVTLYAFYTESIDKNLHLIQKCYNELSAGDYIHATPTLFNACTDALQLNSCFTTMGDDSSEGIMDNLKNCALISRRAGGISISMSHIRPANSYIRGTNGESSGILPQMKIYNEVARTFNQGGGKRKGSFAVYIEPWHGDVLAFLRGKLNVGSDTERARDLFYALWVPDLLIKKVLAGASATWHLFSQDTCPGLDEVYDGLHVCRNCGHSVNRVAHEVLVGAKLFRAHDNAARDACKKHKYRRVYAFTALYNKYVDEHKYIEEISPLKIMEEIQTLMREAGVPYICFKDHVNRRSAQANIGTIKLSNLCGEIVQYTSKDSYSCCCLASINLPAYLGADKRFDYVRLWNTVRSITRNCSRIVDINGYPVAECKYNARAYRPVAIGIQGLADLFAILRIPFIGKEARDLDLKINETIYHAALTESCAIARETGKTYEGFEGSPASLGKLQFDLWRENLQFIGNPKGIALNGILSGMWDWNALKANIRKYGLKESLLIGHMPTVTTSQIMGNNESFEPFYRNIYKKDTLTGNYMMMNKYMIRHFIELGIWNIETYKSIVNNGGSVQHLTIPQDIKNIYKTVYEISQNDIMVRACERSAFICQSQSLNIYPREGTSSILTSIMVNGWMYGLKTGSYYIRIQQKTAALKNNNAMPSAAVGDVASVNTSQQYDGPVCTRQEGCLTCTM